MAPRIRTAKAASIPPPHPLVSERAYFSASSIGGTVALSTLLLQVAERAAKKAAAQLGRIRDELPLRKAVVAEPGTAARVTVPAAAVLRSEDGSVGVFARMAEESGPEGREFTHRWVPALKLRRLRPLRPRAATSFDMLYQLASMKTG